MWLEKSIFIFVMTLFNLLDGYFVDNDMPVGIGRHRRKGERGISLGGVFILGVFST